MSGYEAKVTQNKYGVEQPEWVRQMSHKPPIGSMKLRNPSLYIFYSGHSDNFSIDPKELSIADCFAALFSISTYPVLLSTFE